MTLAFAAWPFAPTAVEAQTGFSGPITCQELTPGTIRWLRSNTPQLFAIPLNSIVEMCQTSAGAGICAFELNSLLEDYVVPQGMSIPDNLVLWRLSPNASQSPETAWIDNAFLYEPLTNSIRFQCLSPATYVLLLSDAPLAINPALSDAGVTSADIGLPLASLR